MSVNSDNTSDYTNLPGPDMPRPGRFQKIKNILSKLGNDLREQMTFGRSREDPLRFEIKIDYNDPSVNDKTAIDNRIRDLLKTDNNTYDSIDTKLTKIREFLKDFDVNTIEKTQHLRKKKDNTLDYSLVINPQGDCPRGVYLLCKGDRALLFGGSWNRVTIAINLDTGEEYICRSAFLNKEKTPFEIEALKAVNEINKQNKASGAPCYLLGGDTFEYDSEGPPKSQQGKNRLSHYLHDELQPTDDLAGYRKVGVLCHFCKGGDLFEALDNLTPTESYRALNHIASGLQQLHDAGWIHRDLKLENVLIDFDENQNKVFLIGDYDTACKKDDYSFTLIRGTIGFRPRNDYLYKASPDAHESSAAKLGRAFDLWGMGLVIELLCYKNNNIYILNSMYEYAQKGCLYLPHNNPPYRKATSHEKKFILIPLIQSYPTRLNNAIALYTQSNPTIGKLLQHLLSFDPNERIKPFIDDHGKEWRPLEYVAHIAQTLQSS